jgi:hypothetical protein
MSQGIRIFHPSYYSTECDEILYSSSTLIVVGFDVLIAVVIVACLLKARIVKPARTAVARERFYKHARC